MAATTRKSRFGRTAIIVANEANALALSSGILRRVIVNNVGVTATLDVYDDATTSNLNKIFEWVSADGKVVRKMDTPFQNGLRVVTGGTAPSVVIVWESA